MNCPLCTAPWVYCADGESGEETAPRPRDITICFPCGAICVRGDDGEAHVMTEAEYQGLKERERDELRASLALRTSMKGGQA